MTKVEMELPRRRSVSPKDLDSRNMMHQYSKRIHRTTAWAKKSARIDLTFFYNLNSWMLWSPVWLPMIFVITPPLSEYCNFRTFIFLLFFLRWNQRYISQWTHLFKNASFFSFLYAILVPRLWPTRIEIHCETCETFLADQVRLEDQTVGWKLRCWRRFPWRIFSRHWGILAHSKLRPHFLNTLIIYIYIWAFDCKIDEAECQNIHLYESLGDFFTRKLKAGVRPVDPRAAIVSPADGKTTFCGPFDGGYLEQVKGVHYSLPYFLGLQAAASGQPLHAAVSDTQDLLHHPGGQTRLYQSVVYLSPGDYHRFHSPVQWKIHTRRHFHGELLSVKPSVVNSCPGLFHLNERVSWIGEWEHGFFSMTAVGATNVGSIHQDDDPDLKTNRPYGRKSQCDVARPCSTRSFYFSEKKFERSFDKGQAFGHFSFGSTIVLIFEAPLDFAFEKAINQRLLVGQAI